ncbi:MAG: Spy/CpxP family protein refolding chaperone [Candidatus Sericytochromatia bacterium]|nr:Spy/CpxP family protein refolding chaperone [Candidatus Sericytochromatia bacterium]
MKTHLTRAVGLALALGTLSGCGSATLLEASALGLDGLLQARAAGVAELRGSEGQGGLRGGERPGGRHADKHRGRPGGPGDGMRGRGPQGEQPLFKGLDLTAEQRTQLQAIAEKYRPARPEGTDAVKPEPPGRQVQALLTAATLDVEALRAALAAQPPTRPPHHEGHTAHLVETRSVLTEGQLSQLVARLEAQPPQAVERPAPPAGKERPDPAARLAELATKLNLTAEQQASLQAFQAAMTAARPAPDQATRQADREAHRAAMIAFWKTGDATQLEALKPARMEPPAFPTEALINLATSLTAEQRQQLFTRGLPGGPGLPGVKGGRGMHGVKGGRGMHGGPGAVPPPPEAAPQG